jgi:hypothetical protein
MKSIKKIPTIVETAKALEHLNFLVEKFTAGFNK